MSTKIIAVSGEKNTGKTTLIERLLPKLIQYGLTPAVIKHDGHSFSPDVPGTDTYRFFSAGAPGTAIYDGEKFMLVKRASVNAYALCEFFPEADIILIEGLKHEDIPKLVIHAGMVSATFFPGSVSRNAIDEIATEILNYISSDNA